jgi:hypothetical protein
MRQRRQSGCSKDIKSGFKVVSKISRGVTVMRIALILDQPVEVVERILRSKPQLLDYVGMRDAISSFGYGWAGVWVSPLKELGWEVEEFYPLVTVLARKWIEQHGGDYKNSHEILACDQLTRFRPDIVLVESPSRYSRSFPLMILDNCPGVKGVFAHLCNPWYFCSDFLNYRGVLTCLKSIEESLIRSGVASYHLAGGFDRRSHRDVVRTRRGAVFIGRVLLSLRGESAHYRRFLYLIYLASRARGVDFYLFEESGLIKNYRDRVLWLFKAVIMIIKNDHNDGLYLKLNLFRRFSAVMRLAFLSGSLKFGAEYFDLLSAYAVGLNIQADVCDQELANMRVFEVTGAGLCLLTNNVKNLSDYFNPEVEVVSFESPEDCLNKINQLCTDLERCRVIASRGQTKTLSRHTYHDRAVELKRIIDGVAENAARNG